MTAPPPTREEVLEGLRSLLRWGEGDVYVLTTAIAYLESEISAGVPEVTELVTLRKEDSVPLLVPRDRVDEFAEAGWFPEHAQDDWEPVPDDAPFRCDSCGWRGICRDLEPSGNCPECSEEVEPL